MQIILSKWFDKDLEENYTSLSLLISVAEPFNNDNELLKQLEEINNVISNASINTKFKLTIEEVNK